MLWCLFGQAPNTTVAAVPSDQLMSPSTRGFVSIADLSTLEQHWRETQLGQLAQDKAMQPFVEDMRHQLQQKLSGLNDKLGVELADLQGVASGEVGLGVVEQPDARAALVVTVDVSGRGSEVNELLAKIDRDLQSRNATKREESSGGAALTVYEIPPRAAGGESLQAVYTLHDDMLLASDSRTQVEEMLARLGSHGGDCLADVKSYTASMSRCQAEAGDLVPEVRWYVDPFGYARSMRSLRKDEKIRGKDYLKILTEQGFDAIQGAGGFLNMSVGRQFELLHRTAVYAPAIPSEPAKYRLGMRIMRFPNGEDLDPQAWIPGKLASYRTFHCDLQNAFEHFDTLFDAIAGYADAFHHVIGGLEVDPYGPQVDVANDFIPHLKTRLTLVTDYELPITTKSERFVFLVEVKDQQAIIAAVEKFMEVDPHAHLRMVEGHRCWEIQPPEDEFSELEIGVGELDPLAPLPDHDTHAGGAGKPAVENSAVCVAQGHLMIASHIDFLQKLLAKPDLESNLQAANDFRDVNVAMEQLVPGPVSARCFLRTCEAYRPTYELLRQGKMPEAETLLGRLLNRMLTPPEDEDEGILRKQKIDGRKLPSFETVRRYFSPAGTVVRSEEDGWFIVGATLAKNPPQARAGSLNDTSARR
jgi:hypothetical protein